MDIAGLPKVELHLHLDCSLSYQAVKILKPGISEAEYRESFIAPPKCTDLADYIKRAIKGFELMQSREQLQLVTADLFEQLKRDRVIYAELRYAPLQHMYEGLSAETVVETINEAVQDGIRITGIEASVILCTLRHYSEEQSMQTAALVKAYSGSPVRGLDIAADEAGFPITNHIRAFEFIRQNGLNCTAHAGEARGADSVWETLDQFQPMRIGHGVRSYEDPKLLAFLKEKNIHLEVCPKSNIQTNVFDKIENHSADILYNAGISVSISTDARTISDTTLEKEYILMEKYFQWQKSHFKKCNLEAIKHSFTSDIVKLQLQKDIEAAYR